MNLILLSGGVDSALCLHNFGAALAVGFDYGQPHRIELDYARNIAFKYKVPFEVFNLPLLPKVDDIVFAGRNAIMLSVGAALAQSRGMDSVTIGCNASDARRFPDCRYEFISELGSAISKAYGVKIHAPFIRTEKSQIVNEARAAGLTDTWTCYLPNGTQPCGECYSCKSLIS